MFSSHLLPTDRTLAFAVWMFCGIGTLGQLDAAEAPSEELARPIHSQRDLLFREVEGVQLHADLYRPDDAKIYPLVIMIHGGAWSAGDKANLRDHARELAQAGFVAVAINYRLAPQFPIAQQLDDCRVALAWAVRQAETWRADDAHVCLWGYSAGAHLASLLATQPTPDQAPLRAVVAGGAPCEFSFIDPDSRVLKHVMGDTRGAVPQMYIDYAPLTHVNNQTCPFFFFHGTADLLVPLASSKKMHRLLLSLEIESEYHAIEGSGHFLSFLNPIARRKAIEFLKKHCEAN